MRLFLFSFVLSLVFVVAGFSQGESFSDPNVEYKFDLPDATWKMVKKPGVGSPNVEFAFGENRANGHFEVRKLGINQSETISDLIERDKEQTLQFIPGYVAGKEENFAGALRGRVFDYEYTRSGKNMSGRFYYLRANDSTVYVVRFTGLRDKLRLIRNQTDSIARTFDINK